MSSQDTRPRATSSQNHDDMMQYLQWPDDQDPSATYDGGRPSNPASAANAGPTFDTDNFSGPFGSEGEPYLDDEGGLKFGRRPTDAAPSDGNDPRAFAPRTADTLVEAPALGDYSQYVDWIPGAVGASYYDPGFESGGPSNHPSDHPRLPWNQADTFSATYGVAPGQGGSDDATGESHQQSGWWRYLEDGTRVWVPAVRPGQAEGPDGSGQGTAAVIVPPEAVQDFGWYEDDERLQQVYADLGPPQEARPSSVSSSDTSVIGESVIGESSVNLDGIGQRNLVNYMGLHSA